MKVLICHTSDFGNLIFATPLIRNLKMNLEAEVFCLIDMENKDAINENPYISEIFLKEETSVSKLIRSNSFDLVIDLEIKFTTWLFSILSGIKILKPKSQKFAEWYMVALRIDQLPDKHYADQLLEVLDSLSSKRDVLGLDYFIPEKDEIERSWLPDIFQKDFVILSLHSAYASRRLPLKKLIEICDRINKPIIVIGDEKDKILAGEIYTFFKKNGSGNTYEKGLLELNKKSVILDLCGKLNRNQIASLTRNCSYVFCHDSWVIPVASAFKKEVFTIWGNTIPEFGKYPYKTKFKILQNNRLDCRPCSAKGYDKCPKGHLKCLNEIIFDFYFPE